MDPIEDFVQHWQNRYGELSLKAQDRLRRLGPMERLKEVKMQPVQVYTWMHPKLFIAIRALGTVNTAQRMFRGQTMAWGAAYIWLLLEYLPDDVWENLMEMAEAVIDTHRPPACLYV